MYSMVQAGSMGLPFLAVRGLLHSDLLRYRSDFLVRDNPFNPGEQVVVVQPIRPDVAVFHALKADRWGHAITPGRRDDVMMARAARRVIVTAEEVVDHKLTTRDAAGHTFLPAIDVDVVARVPYGAHPCSLADLYPRDDHHCRLYLEAAKDESSFQQYLEEYIYAPDGHQEYLQLVHPATHQAGTSS